MPFTPPPDFPQLSTLITSLNTSNLSRENPALYQTIRDIIQKLQEIINISKLRLEALNVRSDNLSNAIVEPASTIFGPVVRGVPNQARGMTLLNDGNIDNLDFGNSSLVRMNNPNMATLRGLKAGVMGQKVTIISVGAGDLLLSHEDVGSIAEDRLVNFAPGMTQLNAGLGVVIYQYDLTSGRWRMIAHHQG